MMQLAGPLQNFGNSWASTLMGWVASGLMIGLTAIVITHAVRKMSIKAAIGGAIGLVICWSLFANRIAFSDMFKTEVQENKPASTAPIQGAGELPREVPTGAFTGQLGKPGLL
ncbi:hypothetical protein ACGF12_22660 [Kitasatospora sp. NPDC048296]|uniref:hypothetical protein n=1 Tax=Kitasatospora sp. NPDC048296 TaxID=3364048 RepID=UPI003711BEBF